MATRTMDRFYETAAAFPAPEGGFAVLLDERSVKTPAERKPLVVPSAPLAEAVAQEWAEQGETVQPQDMPLTALACTALDVATARRADLVKGLCGYAETELLCFRVPHPPELTVRQHALWQPLLDWAALRYDARLNVTTGIFPPEQPPEAFQGLEAAVRALKAMPLAALSAAVRATGSLVLGLALVERRIGAAEAFEAAEIETTFELEEWGEEAEAMKRREHLRAELKAVERFVRLLGE